MKPEIVILDPQGRGNASLDSTSDRLLKGGSWKRQRIVTIIPAADKIQTKTALSWWNLIYPPNQQNIRLLAMGMEVGDAYSQAIDYILAHPEFGKWEYVLTIEHDNLPPHDGIAMLLEQMEAHPEFACISGLYFTKGEGGVAQIWGDINDPIPNMRPCPPRPNELIECYGTGMGFALWRMSMFRDERISRPLFHTPYGKDGVGTQDLAFWNEARKWGYRCAVDCRIKVGHIDENGFIY